jgi:hypothetical protein
MKKPNAASRASAEVLAYIQQLVHDVERKMQHEGPDCCSSGEKECTKDNGQPGEVGEDS